MGADNICSDFGAQENNSGTVSIVSPYICHQMMGLDAIIFNFWMLSFKPDFELLACQVPSVKSLFATLWTEPARLLCPWDSSDKNSGVGCLAHYQGSSWTKDRTTAFFVSCTAGGSLPLVSPGKPWVWFLKFKFCLDLKIWELSSCLRSSVFQHISFLSDSGILIYCVWVGYGDGQFLKISQWFHYEVNIENHLIRWSKSWQINLS